LYLKRLKPDNLEHDIYIISVLLTMAQAHVCCSEPTFHNIKVWLLMCATNAEEFIVYSCVVSVILLQCFAHPGKAPPSSQGSSLVIKYWYIPFWPLLGLKERLDKALELNEIET
jgi:hypothetical protein